MPPSQRYDMPRPAWTRRRALQGLAAGVGAVPTTASCDQLAREVRVPDLRRAGDPDDSAAFARALESSLPVYCPAGQGSGPGGAYIVQSVALRSGAAIRGDGVASVLRLARDARNVLVAESPTAAAPLENIALSDLRIEGRVTETGFREHWDLVSLSGVSGVRIERVAFVGFAGDGLYLGAERGWPVREPRLIRDVLVRDCVFDGVNSDNRNAISVTGGTDITIDRCRFARCTRPTMPGPIDFEPDAFAFYRLERLRVTNCDFDDCGGNVGQIGMVVPAIVPPPRDVLVSGNSFRRYRGTGGDVAITINRQPDAATPSMRCVIEGNVGIAGASGVQIFSGKGVVIRNNRWTDYSGRSLLGFDEPAAGVMDVVVSGDQFARCGWRQGIALALCKGDGVRLERIRFSGTGNGGAGSAPLYVGPGRVRRLALLRNDWRDNPASPGLIIVERGADYLPGTTQVTGNIVPDGRALPTL
jgi:hypothetical protein